MKIRNKLMAILGASALTLSVAGVALADGTINWTGQGVTDGQLNTEQCDNENTAYILFVFTPGGGGNTITGGTLHLGGSGSGDYAINDDNGQWKATTPYYDLSTLTASLDYVGDLGSGNANLVISHGCPGGEQPSETPGFSQGEGGDTDAPSEPNTASIGSTNTSGPADGAWLLVVALGVLLASIVVLTPARAKSRR